MKKRIIWIVAIAMLGILSLLIHAFLNDSRIVAARSITKLNDGLYTMTYKGDYGFDKFLSSGGAATDAEMATFITGFLTGRTGSSATTDTTFDYGCSTFLGNNNGKHLFGRNFDFNTDCMAMIVKTHPETGYSSISTACLNFIGMPDNWLPDNDMQSRIAAISAVYLPLDGMNEKGLCIADLIAGDEEETHQKSDKPDLTITAAIRLLLDKAANVDEAITLLNRYDINSSIGTSHHFAIADASGRSVVVEYINDTMFVTDTKIVTNHYLTQGEKYGIGNELSHLRYDAIDKACCEHNEKMSSTEATDILQAASYPQYTQWSIIFDTNALSATYFWKARFLNEQYDFHIN